MEEKVKSLLFGLSLLFLLIVMLVSSRYSNDNSKLQGRFVSQQSPLQQETIPLSPLSYPSVSGKIDLSKWKATEVAEAIALYNDRLDPAPYPFRYNEDCTYYSLHGDIFGKDIFCSLVYPTFGNQGQEWNDGHLRILHLDYDIKETASQKYQGYLDDVLKETQLDQGLVCYSQDECNGIKVIVCTKDSNNYFSWFEGNVLMTSYNDARRNLNAFTQFYCSSELKPLTGNIVSSINGELITDKIAGFIRRLS